ncbi:MAG: hypothetical protein WA144_06165 [Candidatus Methanoperedens sp.]
MADDSGDFKDMRYAEIFICNIKTLNMMSELPIRDDSLKQYHIVYTDKPELGKLYLKDPTDKLKSYRGKFLASATNKINSVFVALEIPYQAMVHETDKLKIFKYGNDFDSNHYACKKAQRRNEKGQLLIYSEPTKGARKRLNRWMSEEGIKLVGIEVINKIGYIIKK